MKLINADCIEAMKAMPDNSVDSIVTDPPWGLWARVGMPVAPKKKLKMKALKRVSK